MGIQKRFFFIVGLFLFLGCSRSVKPVDPAILLRFQPSPQTYYHVSTVSHQKTVQTVMGRDLINQKNLEYDFTVKVMSVDSNTGNVVLELTVNHIRYVEEDPDRPYNFDSRSSEKNIPLEMQGFANLVGKDLRFIVHPNGTLEKILNQDTLVESMLSDFSNNTKVRLSIKNRYNETTLTEMLYTILPYFSDKKVMTNDSWKRKVEHFGDFPLILEQTYTLQKRNNGIAILNQTSVIKPWTAKESVARQAPTAINYTLNYLLEGKQIQTLEVDEKTGWLNKITEKQSLSGSVQPVQGNKFQQIPKNLIWPIRIESEFTMTSEKVKP